MIYRAIVRDNRDPAAKGRLKVIIPTLSGDSITEWIWPVISSGYLVIPKPGKQVWVLFENGDREVPVWIGMTETTVGYRNLIERVEDLEDEVVSLKSRVSALESAVSALS